MNIFKPSLILALLVFPGTTSWAAPIRCEVSYNRPNNATGTYEFNVDLAFTPSDSVHPGSVQVVAISPQINHVCVNGQDIENAVFILRKIRYPQSEGRPEQQGVRVDVYPYAEGAFPTDGSPATAPRISLMSLETTNFLSVLRQRTSPTRGVLNARTTHGGGSPLANGCYPTTDLELRCR